MKYLLGCFLYYFSVLCDSNLFVPLLILPSSLAHPLRLVKTRDSSFIIQVSDRISKGNLCAAVTAAVARKNPQQKQQKYELRLAWIAKERKFLPSSIVPPPPHSRRHRLKQRIVKEDKNFPHKKLRNFSPTHFPLSYEANSNYY